MIASLKNVTSTSENSSNLYVHSPVDKSKHVTVAVVFFLTMAVISIFSWSFFFLLDQQSVTTQEPVSLAGASSLNIV